MTRKIRFIATLLALSLVLMLVLASCREATPGGGAGSSGVDANFPSEPYVAAKG
jgi:hypothetical protein